MSDLHSQDANRHTGGRRGNGGFALVSVLWIVTVLAILATSVLQISRLHSDISHSVHQRAKARTAADAGFYLAVMQLLAVAPNMKLPEQGWTGHSITYEWEFDGVALSVSVENESSRVDLNFASERTLRDLALAVLGDASRADAIANAILDYRDKDDLRRLDGAEDIDYKRAGRAFGAANGPFQTVDELRRVLGMTQELFEQLRHAVTVFAEAGDIDTTMSTPLVVQAVLGISSEEAKQLVAERIENAGELNFPQIEIARIRAAAQTSSGSRYFREGVVLLKEGKGKHYAILDWREDFVRDN